MAYREIVTKAVIGKGKKKYRNSYQVTVEHAPSTILGCWIINHNFSVTIQSLIIIVAGMICGMFGGIIGVNKANG